MWRLFRREMSVSQWRVWCELSVSSGVCMFVVVKVWSFILRMDEKKESRREREKVGFLVFC